MLILRSEHYQSEGALDKIGKALGEVARSLEKVGADFIVIRINTMHNVNGYIQEMIRKGIRLVGLLGTKYTMEQGFHFRTKPIPG